MTVKEILYRFAENSNGQLVHIDNASKDDVYICPDCKGRFNVRKGRVRQRHFSHQNQSPNCTGEGYLHKTFKMLLVDRLRESMRKNMPVPIMWNCPVCRLEHDHPNLLHGIHEVQGEYAMDQYRPDIALLNQTKTVSTVIEIVHTHEPQENTLQYYREKQIVLLRIKVETVEDIENLTEKLHRPSSVVYHSPLICPNFRKRYQINQQIERLRSVQNRALKPRRPNADELLERSLHKKNRRKKRY